MIIEVSNKNSDILVKIITPLESTDENVNFSLLGYSFEEGSIATITNGESVRTIEIVPKIISCSKNKDSVLKAMFDGCTSDEQLARIVALFNEYPILTVAMDICDHDLFFSQVATAVTDKIITQEDADMLAAKCTEA